MFTSIKNIAIPVINVFRMYFKNNYFPCIVSSIAMQFDNGNCLAEVLGGSG